MVLKKAPGLIPAIDMNSGKAIIYLDKLKDLDDEITAAKMGSEVIGGEMAYLVMSRLMDDIGIGDKRKIVDLQKGCTDVPTFIDRQLKLAFDYGYDGFIGSPLGSGHNPDALTEKEYGSLQTFIRGCKSFKMTPMIVLEMTQPGATHFIREGACEELAKESFRMGVRHFVAPATKPERIKVYRDIIGEGSEIISPGVGPQKTGDPFEDVKQAVYHGTDHPVIGRAWYGSDDPVEFGKRMFETVYKAWTDRKGI